MLRSAPCPIPRRGRGSPTFASICSSSARPPTPTRETLSRTSPQMAAPTTHTPTRRRRSTFSTWAPARCRARSRASPTFSRRRSSPSLRRRARLRRSSRSTRKTSSQTAGEPSSCCAPRGACRATPTTASSRATARRCATAAAAHARRCSTFTASTTAPTRWISRCSARSRSTSCSAWPQSSSRGCHRAPARPSHCRSCRLLWSTDSL
mmetsp:Transcript_40591/g.128345  ORF Transcript_40591/g.128345 Transcript_40591/m.128345 type:complete len:208 (-) Transcript_40591:2548-3171(-)